MATADQNAADVIGRAIDGRIFGLNEEKTILLGAAARIVAIDAEIAALQLEKARIDPRRPPVVPGPPIAAAPTSNVR